MTDTPTPPPAADGALDDDAVRARNTAACDMVWALCKPKSEAGHRDWTMSIPARPDHDPDLVIGASLRDVPKLLVALATARTEAATAAKRADEAERQRADTYERLSNLQGRIAYDLRPAIVSAERERDAAKAEAAALREERDDHATILDLARKALGVTNFDHVPDAIATLRAEVERLGRVLANTVDDKACEAARADRAEAEVERLRAALVREVVDTLRASIGDADILTMSDKEVRAELESEGVDLAAAQARLASTREAVARAALDATPAAGPGDKAKCGVCDDTGRIVDDPEYPCPLCPPTPATDTRGGEPLDLRRVSSQGTPEDCRLLLAEVDRLRSEVARLSEAGARVGEDEEANTTGATCPECGRALVEHEHVEGLEILCPPTIRAIRHLRALECRGAAFPAYLSNKARAWCRANADTGAPLDDAPPPPPAPDVCPSCGKSWDESSDECEAQRPPPRFALVEVAMLAALKKRAATPPPPPALVEAVERIEPWLRHVARIGADDPPSVAVQGTGGVRAVDASALLVALDAARGAR